MFDLYVVDLERSIFLSLVYDCYMIQYYARAIILTWLFHAGSSAGPGTINIFVRFRCRVMRLHALNSAVKGENGWTLRWHARRQCDNPWRSNT